MVVGDLPLLVSVVVEGLGAMVHHVVLIIEVCMFIFKDVIYTIM